MNPFISQLALLVQNCCHFQHGFLFHTPQRFVPHFIWPHTSTPPFRSNLLSRLPLIFITSLPNSLIPSPHYSFYSCNIIESLAPQVQIPHSQIGAVIIDIRAKPHSKTLIYACLFFFCSFITSMFLCSSCPPPVGVLFSVEVMCSHFSLRHYFPCFFSAACGTLTFRLLSVWSGDIGKADSEHWVNTHPPPMVNKGKLSFWVLKWGNMTRPEN